MFTRRLFFIGFCVLALCGGASAQTTVSFATLSQAGAGLRSFGSSLDFEGLRFTSTSGGFGNELGVWQASSPNLPVGGVASTALLEYFAGATTTITTVSGEAFNLLAIDLAPWGSGQVGTMTVTFFGTTVNGSSVNQSFQVANSGASTPTLQTFSFAPSFTDLTAVRVTQGVYQSSTAFQFTDLVVSAVPEPQSHLLLLAGVALVLLHAIRRRAIALPRGA
jgi:hypothetical protein